MKALFVALGFITLAAAADVERGKLVENVACSRDATQTYTLYLPSSYSAARKWPVLFIFDPRSRGTVAAELFRAGAEAQGWILLSSNNTRSDSTWEVNERALQAMLPELSKYSVAPDRIYAAGFSGGATVAWMLVMSRHFAGVINSGQPWQPELQATRAQFDVWGATGRYDFNNADVRKIDAEVADASRSHHVEVFEGVHQWMPEPLARQAIEWHELNAMFAKKRDADNAFIARMYDEAMTRAADDAAAGRELSALRRYREVVASFRGHHDVTAAEQNADALASSRVARNQAREERDADAYEKRELAHLIDGVRQALAEQASPATASRLVGLTRIQDAAKQETEHGFAARRALEALFAQCGFYLPQQFFAAHEYDKAATVLAVAAAVKPDRANIHYDLARAQARTGRAKEALASLERAIELAPRNAETARTEADFESLRNVPRFAEIVR